MSGAALERLPVTDLASMMREGERLLYVQDKSYQGTPIGAEVRRFLNARRFAGASPNTLDSYERTLSKLALRFADFTVADFCSPVGTDYLREFLDRFWGDASVATRAQRLSAVKSLFRWESDEGRIPFDPAKPIRGPRVRNRERNAYPHDVVERLVSAQAWLRDQCALELLAHMALRKNELRLLQIRDVDLARNLLVVRHGKGGKSRILPLGYSRLRDDLYLHVVGEERGPNEYLLYPKRDRSRPMNRSSIHRWFKRCLTRAGLPDTIEMHELRHTAADELRRVKGDLTLAQQLLGHESLATTQAYLHPTRADLAAAMRTVEESWAEVVRSGEDEGES